MVPVLAKYGATCDEDGHHASVNGAKRYAEGAEPRACQPYAGTLRTMLAMLCPRYVLRFSGHARNICSIPVTLEPRKAQQ